MPITFFQKFIDAVKTVCGRSPDTNGNITLGAADVGAYPQPTGSTVQYIRGDGTLQTFPTIPAAQVNADWNASSGVAQILNKPTLTGFATLVVGTSAQYVRGNGTLATLNQAAVPGLTTTDSPTFAQIGVNTSSFGTNNRVAVNPYTTVDNAATMILSPSAIGNKGLVIQAYSGQTATLLEFQNSAGGLMSFINQTGSPVVGKIIDFGASSTNIIFGGSNHYIDFTVSGTDMLKLDQANGYLNAMKPVMIGATVIGTSNQLVVNPYVAVDNAATVIITPSAIGNKALVLQMLSGQTGDALEVQTYGGANLLTISGAGVLNTSNINTTNLSDQSGATNAKFTFGGSSKYIQLNANNTDMLRVDGGSACINMTNCKVGIATATYGTNNKLLVNPYVIADNAATMIVSPSATGNKGLVIQGMNGQSVNLFEVQDYTGSAKTYVTQANLLYSTSMGTPTLWATHIYDNASSSDAQINLGGANKTIALNCNSQDMFICDAVNAQITGRIAGSQVFALTSSGMYATTWMDTLTANNSKIIHGGANKTITLNCNNQDMLVCDGTNNQILLKIGGSQKLVVGAQGMYCTMWNDAASGSNSYITHGGSSKYITLNANATDMLKVDGANGCINHINCKVGIGTSTYGTNNAFVVNPYTVADNAATAIISPSASGNKGLVIQGVNGQSVNLFEIQDYTGAVKSYGRVDGTIAGVYLNATTAVNTYHIYDLNNSTNAAINFGSTSKYITLQANSTDMLKVDGANGCINIINAKVGIGTSTYPTNMALIVNPYSVPDNNATVCITPTAITSKNLILQLYSGQTADMLQFQTETGSVQSYFDKNGRLNSTVLIDSNNLNTTIAFGGSSKNIQCKVNNVMMLVLDGTNNVIDCQNSMPLRMDGTNTWRLLGYTAASGQSGASVQAAVNGTTYTIPVLNAVKRTKSFDVMTPTVGDKIYVWRAPVSGTLTRVSGINDGGTSVTGSLTQNLTGTTTTLMAATAFNATDTTTTTFSQATFSAGAWIYFSVTALSGTPSNLGIMIEYVENIT